MDPKNIERYSRWARPVLEAGVRARMLLLGIAPEGDASRVEAGAASAGGAVLSAEEARMRDALLAELDERGEDELVRRAAYTWFNRLLALRYLELKGLFPHGRHVLSDAAGTGLPPEAASEPEALNLPTLPREVALRLKAAGDAQTTFRAVLVAQAGALARALPKAFGPEGDPLALLLPDGLLGPEGAVRRLVEDVPAADLEKPEALGWAYQYWVAEERAIVETDYKKKSRRVTAEEIPAVTQIFTPEWIVDYLVQNSLGRLWMLNVPDSSLADAMPYYVVGEDEGEPALAVSTPEEITFCDPACGSGHMMLAAFRLLGAMYEEVGYRRRDVPALVFANNLAGMEIDARAAQLAELCLALEACSWNRNFLARPEGIDITVLAPVVIEPSELPRSCALARNKELLDALSHLSLCGSLLEPSAKNVSDIKAALASLPAGLGDADLRRRLEAALTSCEALSRQFSLVVTNPPYMGSKKMPSWLKGWVEKRYPDAKRDLCTCFILREIDGLKKGGLAGLATSNVWMFISSYEKLREEILATSSIDTLVQLSAHGFKGVAAQICAFVLSKGPNPNLRGGYIRLNDFDHHSLQKDKTLQAIQNPSCGWFYRRSAADFKDIPGTPIAYWASDALIRAFKEGKPLKDVVAVKHGLTTGNNDRFLRLWWEIEGQKISFTSYSIDESIVSEATWFPLIKGGDFRKWYGNNIWMINWYSDGRAVRGSGVGVRIDNPQYYFRECITWSNISSGRIAFRYQPMGFIFDHKGPSIFSRDDNLGYLQGLLNSSVINQIAALLSPTLTFEVGQVGLYPVVFCDSQKSYVSHFVESNRALSKSDYDSYEISWDFASSPLVPRRVV